MDVGDHVVSNKSLSQNCVSLDWRPGPVKVGQKFKNTPTLGAPSRRTPNPNQKIFFNRNYRVTQKKRSSTNIE